MKILLILFIARIIYFNDVSSKPGLNLISHSPSGVEIEFSLPAVKIEDVEINGEVMQEISAPGVFLMFNKEGAPNVPGTARFIAIPLGARAIYTIIEAAKEVFKDINLIPMHDIPRENDSSPLKFEKDFSIYSKNSFYPESPVKLSKPMKIRGVDAVKINITPFQYNPVGKELIVYKRLRIKVDFIGGNGHFGENRLRSRFWEPVLWGNLINYASLPEIDFSEPSRYRGNGYEYVVITRNDPDFLAWADTIKRWRTLEGIKTGVFTTNEIGGNTPSAIETFIDTAYQNWQIPPVAVLFLGDYPEPTSYYDGNCHTYTDNLYADVGNQDTLPDLYCARIFADTPEHLQIFIGKILEYERNPPTSFDFYDHPLIITGWQTERWFQLFAEVIRGFFINIQGKHPKRSYIVYSGTPYPGRPWSTAQNTYLVVDYFGPNGLGYIPEINPYDYDWWNSGDIDSIVNAINSGTFGMFKRGHLSDTTWLSPLNNDMYPHAFLIEDASGYFIPPGECLLEKFLRYPKRGVGGNGATQVTYAFVTDTYGWGLMDGLWTEFMPDYPLNDPIPSEPPYRNLRPALAVVHGKYFLEVSNWPYLSHHYKVITYELFHFFGDAFQNMYSEVPQPLNVSHPSSLPPGATEFPITADDSSWICLTKNFEIIGEAEGTGSQINILIPPVNAGDTVVVTVTKYNHLRYSANVPVGLEVGENAPKKIGKDKNEIFSVTGRKVNAKSLNTGIYFIKSKKQGKKIIKIYK